PCSDVHQVGDEREVEVLPSFNWPLSELIMEDGVLLERGLHEIAMADWESQCNDKATYSASAVGIAVQSCFFDIQRTSLSYRNWILPEVLLRVSRQPAWSVSEKAVSSKPESFGYQSPM
ncbi:hypothetical protein Tco_1155562, partial [Tanacetum coccineum]